MKRIGIFGAGQAGMMIKRWIPGSQQLCCYIDNNEKKQGTSLEDYPVLSLKDAIGMELDVIWLAVLNREARAAIITQIRAAGFDGDIINIEEMKERMDIRLSAIRLLAEAIQKRNVSGAVAELGVFQGELAKELNRLFPERKLYLFDTFEGFQEEDIVIEQEKGSKRAGVGDFSNTSVELVRSKLPYPEQAVFCKGYFPESLGQLEIYHSKRDKGDVCSDIATAEQDTNDKYEEKLHRETDLQKEDEFSFALVSLDPDLYEPTYQGLKYFYPRLAVGGAIVIHDYNSIQFPGVKRAVDEYCIEHNLFILPLMDLHGTGVLIKQG